MGDIIAAVALWIIVGILVVEGVNRIQVGQGYASMTGSTFGAAVIIWPWFVFLGLKGIARALFCSSSTEPYTGPNRRTHQRRETDL